MDKRQHKSAGQIEFSERHLSGAIQGSLHRPLLNGYFRVEGRRTWFEKVDELQKSLDDYLALYNENRPHQGRNMNGRTPARAFVEGLPKPDQQKGEKQTRSTPKKQAA